MLVPAGKSIIEVIKWQSNKPVSFHGQVRVVILRL